MSNLIDSRLMVDLEAEVAFYYDKVKFFEKERDQVEDTRDGAYDYYEGLVDAYGVCFHRAQDLLNRARFYAKDEAYDTLWTCPTCNDRMLYWQESDHKAKGCTNG